ncbi:MAG TPA: DUF2867 domain-containing protein, partial [Desulfobaccales bacterium]
NRIRVLIPQELLDCRSTIRLALQRIAQQQVETCWSDAGLAAPPEWAQCGDADYAGGTVLSLGYEVRLRAAPSELWEPLMRVGGRTGWYFGNYLWKLRGLLDRLAGGVGLRRGRRHPEQLQVGDALDFFRVLDLSPHRRLLLLAEMKLPGEATLEFRLSPEGHGEMELTMLARFLPRGLGGLAYWYLLSPFHRRIYQGMLRAIAAAADAAIVYGPQRLGQGKK